RAVRRRRDRASSGTSPRKVLLFSVAIIAAIPLLGLAAMGAVAQYWYNTYAEDYRPIDEMVLTSHAQLTEIYDRRGPEEGVLLGTLTNPTAPLHEPVPLEEISEHMI